jgi:hypothetical protein
MQPTRAFMSRPPIFRTCPFLIIAGASQPASVHVTSRRRLSYPILIPSGLRNRTVFAGFGVPVIDPWQPV